METFLFRESELPMINVINMTLKYKIATLKNLTEMRQMTLSDPLNSVIKIPLIFTPLKLPKNTDGENV